MTDKIVVNAVENHFVPLLIHNNSGGYDKKILNQFNEPSWNYQVVRFIDEKNKDIIPRKDEVWTKLPLLKRMKKALSKAGKPVPQYLNTAISEANRSHHKTVAISQHCFWTGEARLGKINGVVHTEAGWFKHREVTRLTYDSSVINITELLKEAKKLRCANAAFILNKADLAIAKKSNILPSSALNRSYKAAQSSDQKKQINRLKLPRSLSVAQQTKFNAYYHTDINVALSYLTESQQAFYKKANR